MATGLSRLAREMAGAGAPGNRPRCWVESGVVKAVTNSGANPTMTVTWRGATVPASYTSGYTPAAGDVVLLLVQPPTLICLGRLIGP